MVKFRAATIEDLPNLLELEQKIVDAERLFDPYLKENDATYYDLPELIADSNSYLLVAESDGEIIGSGYAQIRPSKACFMHDRHCYLGFIYVESTHRGQSLGQGILDALKDWGIQRGMHHYHLNVYSENDPAIRAYEKAGFKRVSIKMELVV